MGRDTKYCCGAFQSRPSEHWNIVHQETTLLTFPGENGEIIVSRHSQTKKFVCPRCSASFSVARKLQDHARKDCLDSSPNPHPRRFVAVVHNVSSPPSQWFHSVSLPGRAPRRRRVPDISRTNRALIRDYYRQNFVVAQITEYLHLDSWEVRYAINNEAGDNLEDDTLYLDGSLGDIINVENMDTKADVVKAEEAEVEEKLDVDCMVDLAESVHDIEAGVADMSTYGSTSVDTQPLLEPSSSSTRADKRPAMNLDEVADHHGGSGQTYPLPSSLYQGRQSAGQSSRDPSGSSSISMSNSKASSSATLQPQSPPVGENPLAKFLCSLRPPCGHLEKVFQDFGVRTSEDLNALRDMEEYWEEVRTVMFSLGVTPWEWIRITNGFRSARSKAN